MPMRALSCIIAVNIYSKYVLMYLFIYVHLRCSHLLHQHLQRRLPKRKVEHMNVPIFKLFLFTQKKIAIVNFKCYDLKFRHIRLKYEQN